MASYNYYTRAASLILIILLTSPPMRAARSLSQAHQRPPLRIKLDLARLHISPAGKFSYAHLQHALHRTSLRLSHFHYKLQLHAGGAAASLSSSSSSSSYSTPVFADSSSVEFLTTLSIGTPPVSFNAIVDTGSDLVWLQCQPCSSCSTNDFDPSLSSTYSVLPCSNTFCSNLQNTCGTDTTASCSYNASYGDRSFSIGDLSLDTLTLPDPSGAAQLVESFTFGCGHDNQFTSSVIGAVGIVGLGLGPLSLPSQLGISLLSYCLQSITDPASKTSQLYLGEVAQLPPSSNGPTLTTQFFTNPIIPVTYYYVKLNGISVGGQLVTATTNGAFDMQPNGMGGMIFDSGTTITSLKSDTYNDAIVDAFTSSIALTRASTSSGLCYELSSASNIQLLSLTFHFEGADLQLPQDNYFMAHEANNLICLTLGPSNQIVSIFGNMQQQNFFITYNLQAQNLSLTPTICDS